MAFSTVVHLVFNQEDFYKFQVEVNDPEFNELKFTTTITIYLDDLHIITRTLKQHYYTLAYVMRQGRKFNLKLNPSKWYGLASKMVSEGTFHNIPLSSEILTKQVECLGFALSPSRRVMSLSQPRARLIQAWACPQTPKVIILIVLK